MKYKLKRFGVLKAALFLALWGFFIGLFMTLVTGIIYSVMFSSVSLSGPPADTQPSFITGDSIVDIVFPNYFSWSNLLWFPFVYAILFFALGFIFTLIINLILKIIKGFDLELEETGQVFQQQNIQKPQISQVKKITIPTLPNRS
ncbi:MAG: hypothetical protein KKF48_01200 [Nanoarchaeota archaeon]|nr:hypothetical protein [Nanoarchaeota archaeon]MBU1027639.1 hypothetical protein [Nanoarchaeota archaeon]